MTIFAQNKTVMALNIKKVISSKGLTSKEVAGILRISTVSFSNMINGNPTVDTLEKIASAIGCEISDFFERKEQTNLKCPHCGGDINVEIK